MWYLRRLTPCFSDLCTFPTSYCRPSSGLKLPVHRKYLIRTKTIRLRLLDSVFRQHPTLRTQPLSSGFFRNAHTFVVKPLERAVVVVTTHHLPKGHLLADAVEGRIFSIILVFHACENLGGREFRIGVTIGRSACTRGLLWARAGLGLVGRRRSFGTRWCCSCGRCGDALSSFLVIRRTSTGLC